MKGIVAALQLEHQVDVDPGAGASPAQAPDDVVVAHAEVLPGMGFRHRLEALEVELVEPWSGHEAADEAFDEVGIGEEEFVAAVVDSHS